MGRPNAAHEIEILGGEGVTSVTLSLDTNAYAAGDVLAATQEVANVYRVAGGYITLQYITVMDKDDQKVAMQILLLDVNTSIGAENAAPDPDDTEALNVTHIENIYAHQYIDLGGAAYAGSSQITKPLKAAAGTTSLWIAAITNGAPTHTAAGVVVTLHYFQR